MNKETIKKVLLSLYHYFCFFLVIAFAISCCMALFITALSKTMEITFTEANISTAAILTFWNVVLLSLICTIIDAVRRRYMIDKPVKMIVDAAEKIAKGDYSVRIPSLHRLNRADDGLDRIVDCFNKMAEELSGVESLQTDFIANASHELKTPLAVMQNYGTLLQTADLSEEERMKYAKGITESSHRLADLITNILKLNKLENQQIYPTMKPYNLSEQLCECLLNFEHVWEEKEIEIEVDIAEDVILNADPELLSLVWNNLLSNALKFTGEGGIVKVVLTEEEDMVIVKVSDTGCGIAPEIGRRIFDKFYQGDTSRATQGNGLGLALVKRVIDIMHGQISVESALDKGTTFTVRIRKDGK